MDEKTKRLVERQKDALVQLARTQAHSAIGEVAERMHLVGAEITREALIAELLAAAHSPQAQLIEREKFEEAARRLGWALSAPTA